MVTIMIVDDEAVIRRGIQTSIDWEAHGGRIIGEARNGEQALRKVKDLSPDLLFVDIRMPVMDGLALTEAVRKIGMNTKIVILTGFNDVEYAKQALKLKVEDFLLKPVEAKQLLCLFQKLKRDFEEEQRQQKERYDQEQLVRANLPLMHSDFFKRLIRREMTEQEAKETSKNLGLSIEGPYYQMVLFEIDDDRNEHSNELQISFQNVVHESGYLHGFIAEWTTGQHVGFFNLPSHQKQTVLDVSQKIQDEFRKRCNRPITAAVGYKHKGFERIVDSFQEAKNALETKIYKGTNTLLRYEPPSSDQKGTTRQQNDIDSFENEQTFTQSIQLTDKTRLTTSVEQIFDRIKRQKASFQEIKTVCIRLLIAAERTLSAAGVDDFQTVDFDEMDACQTLSDIQSWFLQQGFYFISVMEHAKTSKYHYIVKSVLEYVHDHYDQPITLETVSSLVYITPNYFSRIFKEETGQTFVDWLNTYRIEKAKALLKKHRRTKTSEIAEQVGFNDYKYFSYIFKKVCGSSPRKYRRL